MGKPLSEMTLEELWELFPIFLVEHNSQWDTWYQEEERFISAELAGMKIYRISHVGSIAIKGIWAKNIVDIMLEIAPEEDIVLVAEVLKKCGYRQMSTGENRVSLNKGYSPEGFLERVFHLHVRLAGDNNELYFRDFLNDHADVAKDYERLKLALWKKYEHNRDGYTEAKTEFIEHWTKVAQIEYRGRYALSVCSDD